MASDIKITSLMAVGGVGSVTLTAYAASPLGMTCLPYMQASKIEFWVSNNNNRANATKLTESEVGVAVQGGLAANVTRYYWARAIDPEGNEGEFYPVSPTGGISATTLTTAPGPNSVGPSELQPNAVQTTHIANLAVTNAKIASLAADKLTAGTITATISIQGPTITGGTIRTTSGSNRVQMDGSLNEFSVYRSGTKIARLGYTPSGSFDAILALNVPDGLVPFTVYSTGGTSSIGVAALRNGAGTALYGECMSSTSTFAVVGVAGSGGGIGRVGNGTANGGYAFYAAAGGYGPFTGQHDAMIEKDDPAQPGDIVFDKKVLLKSGWDDSLTEVAITTEVGQRAVVGILSRRLEFEASAELACLPMKDHRKRSQILRGIGEPPQPGAMRRRWAQKYHRATINSVGEGVMHVCGRGGNIAAGDLICASDLAGKGQRQHDDIVRSWTVAKARESVTFDQPDQVKRVAVIYLCG